MRATKNRFVFEQEIHARFTTSSNLIKGSDKDDKSAVQLRNVEHATGRMAYKLRELTMKNASLSQILEGKADRIWLCFA